MKLFSAANMFTLALVIAGCAQGLSLSAQRWLQSAADLPDQAWPGTHPTHRSAHILDNSGGRQEQSSTHCKRDADLDILFLQSTCENLLIFALFDLSSGRRSEVITGSFQRSVSWQLCKVHQNKNWCSADSCATILLLQQPTIEKYFLIFCHF